MRVRSWTPRSKSPAWLVVLATALLWVGCPSGGPAHDDDSGDDDTSGDDDVQEDYGPRSDDGSAPLHPDLVD